ncbi:uncharacterized protein [Antennarius striatus]
MQIENQVEEYEKELARAKWRLRKLREEVDQARRKVEDTGNRNTPLQDSIRQSYEEILQEEHTLCSLSGGVMTPESQLDGLMSPAYTVEDDPLPVKPWGRSQSLPAYADLIMRTSCSTLCNNLGNAREVVNSDTSSPKMERSDTEDDADDDIKEDEKSIVNTDLLCQLDFYQADPFAHCQSDDNLLSEDLFAKTDSSDGFPSDPFKGSDPFATDMLYLDMNVITDGEAAHVSDDVDKSLSCAEIKVSTGTQCFESEFPDEDSDIEISYSQEDLDAIAVADDCSGYKPIENSTEELGAEPIMDCMSKGPCSVESNPEGYESGVGTVSHPSDKEEQSLGSLAGNANEEGTEFKQGVRYRSAQTAPLLKQQMSKPGWRNDVVQTLTCNVAATQGPEWVNNIAEEPRNSDTTQTSLDCQNLFTQSESDQNRQLSLELSYISQSSFDPYGFKLSPEHSIDNLLDPDKAEPTVTENNPCFVAEPSNAQPDQLYFDPYEFGVSSSRMSRDFDPYGFKLSPEADNQKILDHYGNENTDAKPLCTSDISKQIGHCSYKNQEALETHTYDNKEMLDLCGNNNKESLNLFTGGNQELLELSNIDHMELDSIQNQEGFHPCCHENQEVVQPYDIHTIQDILEPCNYDNQEVMEPCSYREQVDFPCPDYQEVLELDNPSNQELSHFIRSENQDELDSGIHINQEQLDHGSKGNQGLLDLGNQCNQEVLQILSEDDFPESNNNQSTVELKINFNPTECSSDADVACNEQTGLQLHNTSNCANQKTLTTTADTLYAHVYQGFSISNAPSSHELLESDMALEFGTGGYSSCPDVADDLETPDRAQANPITEPVRPIRPPRPSLRAKDNSQSQGIDLK